MPIFELKSRNLQQIQRVCSTYASGFGRLLDRRATGCEELRMARPVLAAAVVVAEGSGWDALCNTCARGVIKHGACVNGIFKRGERSVQPPSAFNTPPPKKNKPP